MFINLIEKASGQTIDDFMVSRGVTINNTAFTDTNDKAVLVANETTLYRRLREVQAVRKK